MARRLLNQIPTFKPSTPQSDKNLMILAKVLTMVALLQAIPAFAEYRAFELVIADPTSGQESIVISNLDPNQYRLYYPVKAGVTVKYRATWMCRGNTSNFQPICANPKAQN